VTYRWASERGRVFVSTCAAVIAIALCSAGAATAQTSAPVSAIPPAAGDTASVELAVDVSITVRADRGAEEINVRRLKVLGEAAVQSAGQYSQTFIEGMESLDIVESYTLKTSGQKIPVEPANIITRDAASGSLLHLRDLKVRTVVYSDVAVGDSVVTVTRRNRTTGIFQGEYLNQFLFPREIPYAPSTIRIAAPTSLGLKVAVYGDGLEDKVVVDGDITRHDIHYQPPPRRHGEAGASSSMDHDPRVLVSTFSSYEEQARSYWVQTRERTQVTPEIQALADTITSGIADKRAQAEAIDRWVKRNIRYVAIYLGSGRVIPYPAATVLKHKFGDCKDHATLMTALLTAKDIASEHVLISSGTAYSLPEPPTMGYINHVIVYLPEFDLYDDPTAGYAAFGVLGVGTYDKPVVRVSDAGARRARTPAMKAADHTSINRTRIMIAADGTVTGATEQIATGVFATSARQVAASIQNIGLESAVEKKLRALGTPGTGRFEIGPLSQLDDTYVIKSRFTYNAHLRIRARMMWPIPRGTPIQARPGEYLFGKRFAGRQLPFVCRAGRQIEEIELILADGLPLPRRLKGRVIDTRLFSYASHYTYDRNIIKVRREFESRVPGQVCAPEIEAEIAADLKIVHGSINTRLYFPTAPVAPPAAKTDMPPNKTGAGTRALDQAKLTSPAVAPPTPARARSD
jgi:transglutaminase-like putative cysteine protease